MQRSQLFAAFGCAASLLLLAFACGQSSSPSSSWKGADASDEVLFVDVVNSIDAQPVVCRPSASSAYTPPSKIDGYTLNFGGLECVHPEVKANCSAGWCEIPNGCFIAGSPENEWGRGAYGEEQRAVTLTHSIVVSQYETTRAQWQAVSFADPTNTRYNSDSPAVECSDSPQCPVATVGWHEALAYANALSRKEGFSTCYDLSSCRGAPGNDMKCDNITLTPSLTYDCLGYRLPSIVESEYVTRAGTQTSLYSGSITNHGVGFGECCIDSALDRVAWYCANSNRRTHPVGEKLPNAWGLFDLLGNATEWVLEDSPRGSTAGNATDPGGRVGAKQKGACFRGGAAWLWPEASRSAAIALGWYWATPIPTGGIGFRLVRTLPKAP